MENDKFLPLIWLDVLHLRPKRDCAVPDETFSRGTRQFPGEIEQKAIFGRKFAWILSWQRLDWSMEYLAQARGICSLENLTLVSGDGFGLTVREKTVRLSSPVKLVVYPRIIPVDLRPFLRPLYDCAGGGAGYFEDRTLLKNSRDYLPGDSFKSINWRMAAKSQKLQSNVYEKILPRAAFFVLDAESFKKGTDPEFEEILEVLASLILRLQDQQMNCGLTLPGNPGSLHIPSCKNSGNILADLAGIERPVEKKKKKMGKMTSEDALEDEQILLEKEEEEIPLLFPVSEILSYRDLLGQVYIAARDPESVTCRQLVAAFGEDKVRYIFCENPQGIHADHSMTLEQVRKGAEE
ncbi:MAG: DUF58 domain-containing protein [Firmicutes bacterium]|nr:DUF58 domain-containing protein [Bacillota bacterium]